jgi:hypothetical protein
MSKEHFSKFAYNFVLFHGSQDLLNVLQMFLWGFSKDEDVIQIQYLKWFCEWTQYIFHHLHECGQGIIQAARNDQPLKATLFRIEGCFPDINLLNPHLVVAWLHINLTKRFGTLEFK